LWPCDYRGRYADGPKPPSAAPRRRSSTAKRPSWPTVELHRRYGWQYNLVPLLKVPGVKNVDHDLALRDKLRRATAKNLWPDSAIVEVTLIRSDVRG
jgi:hypothetical protein